MLNDLIPNVLVIGATGLAGLALMGGLQNASAQVLLSRPLNSAAFVSAEEAGISTAIHQAAPDQVMQWAPPVTLDMGLARAFAGAKP